MQHGTQTGSWVATGHCQALLFSAWAGGTAGTCTYAFQHVAALSIRRVVEAYSKGGLLTNDQPEAQRKLL
jgi:hypothetical protein